MSKYIDLKDIIHAETRDQVYLDEVGEVLRWLDAHPDQVPGRTITEREYRHAMLAATDTEDFDAEELLRLLGLTVIPDPEPTNAENLEQDLMLAEVNAGSDPTAIARWLAGQGWVKAPEANDD